MNAASKLSSGIETFSSLRWPVESVNRPTQLLPPLSRKLRFRSTSLSCCCDSGSRCDESQLPMTRSCHTRLTLFPSVLLYITMSRTPSTISMAGWHPSLFRITLSETHARTGPSFFLALRSAIISPGLTYGLTRKLLLPFNRGQ